MLHTRWTSLSRFPWEGMVATGMRQLQPALRRLRVNTLPTGARPGSHPPLAHAVRARVRRVRAEPGGGLTPPAGHRDRGTRLSTRRALLPSGSLDAERFSAPRKVRHRARALRAERLVRT